MIYKPLKILFVSPEAAPFAKTGGLADVAGALPCALAKLGHQVRLVIPRYGSIDGAAYGFKEWLRLEVPSPSGASRPDRAEAPSRKRRSRSWPCGTIRSLRGPLCMGRLAATIRTTWSGSPSCAVR